MKRILQKQHYRHNRVIVRSFEQSKEKLCTLRLEARFLARATNHVAALTRRRQCKIYATDGALSTCRNTAAGFSRGRFG